MVLGPARFCSVFWNILGGSRARKVAVNPGKQGGSKPWKTLRQSSLNDTEVANLRRLRLPALDSPKVASLIDSEVGSPGSHWNQSVLQ